MSNQTADVIAYNGKIATQNEQRSMAEAVAIRDGKFLAVGTDAAGQKRMRLFRCSNLAASTPEIARSWAMLAKG